MLLTILLCLFSLGIFRSGFVLGVRYITAVHKPKARNKVPSRTSWLAAVLTISCLHSPSSVHAQDMSALKPAVVRIENGKLNEVGTGFIVKIDARNVYIVTASHVVRGEQFPKIYLFSQQFESLTATVLDREDDDTRGLALLLLKPNEQTLSKLTALKAGHTSGLGNGESVKIIGFPGGTTLWTVDNGNIKRLEGRNLVLSGAISGGNSGGPVILNQYAIGLVTDVSQSDAYAARVEIIVPYVNGIVPGLIMIDPRSKADDKTQAITLNVSLDKIVVYEDGSSGSTRWNFEVFVDTNSIISLGQKRMKGGTVPINKGADIEVEPNKSYIIKVIGDKSEAGVQAVGETTLQWDPLRTRSLSKEISVKVPRRITSGNFTFYFTIEKKFTGKSSP